MAGDPPVMVVDRFDSLMVTGGFAVAVLVAGLVLHWLVARGSGARLHHGRYVLAWSVAGCLAGGVYGASVIDNVQYLKDEADIGMCLFGMLVGWAVGMIHGAWAIDRVHSNRADG